jgi:hydrogenase 3 maturation protease
MDFEDKLANGLGGVVVVMGIGNPLRGDDAAGSLVARRIEARPNVCVIDAQDVPEEFVVRVVDQRPDTIVLIDSMDLGSAPGSVAFLGADQLAEYWPSTHRVPLGSLMRIIERETGARVVGIGIQPAHTEFLEPLSDAVAASVAEVADALNAALARGRAAVLKGEVPA